MITTFPLRGCKWIKGQSWWKHDKSVVDDDDHDGDNDGGDDDKRKMSTSTIMISCWDDIRLPYDTKKPLDDEDLATDGLTDGPTDGQTDKSAYRDASTHLKTKR